MNSLTIICNNFNIIINDISHIQKRKIQKLLPSTNTFAIQIEHIVAKYKDEWIKKYEQFIGKIDNKFFSSKDFFKTKIIWEWETSLFRESDILKNTNFKNFLTVFSILNFIRDLKINLNSEIVIIGDRSTEIVKLFQKLKVNCIAKQDKSFYCKFFRKTKLKLKNIINIFRNFCFLMIFFVKFLIILFVSFFNRHITFKINKLVVQVYADEMCINHPSDLNKIKDKYWKNFNFSNYINDEEKPKSYSILAIPKSIYNAILFMPIKYIWKNNTTSYINILRFLSFSIVLKTFKNILENIFNYLQVTNYVKIQTLKSEESFELLAYHFLSKRNLLRNLIFIFYRCFIQNLIISFSDNLKKKNFFYYTNANLGKKFLGEQF